MITQTVNINQNNLDFDSSQYSVLIVDDNPTNLAVIVDYLEDVGFNILVSQDGESSLKRTRYANPDIILLDVLMPGIDGYQTCHQLKADPQTRDIPVIFMTALSNTDDKVKGFQTGAVDYITKPIQPEEVLARIKLHLQLRSMTKTLSQQNDTLTLEIKQRQQAEQQLQASNSQLQQEIVQRIQVQSELKKLNENLEDRIQQRTFQLKRINQKLQREIQERKQTEIKLKNSLKEKEILLKEIHHRVKNNLLVVSSLLELQADYIDDEEMLKMFEDSQDRIHSMALIHEQLYRSQNLKKLDFADYLNALVDKVSDSYDVSEKGIQFLIEAEPTLLNMETAHPCGLIVNELIDNSLEHAFSDGRSGFIYISLKQNKCEYTLLIKDNGMGFPADVDFRQTESLGLQLVCILTEQLEGKIELDTSNGTCFQVTFCELDYCDRL